MTRYAFAFALAALSITAAPLLAADGILIVQKTTGGSGAMTNNVQIEQNRVRAETQGRGGGTQGLIFDGTKQTLWIVNDAQKTYTELTKADVDRLASQMSGAMAMMQEQMKNMPPEQRARIEAMMAGRGMPAGGAPSAKLVYKKVGTDTVGRWACDKYEGYEGDRKASEVCTVDPKVLGFAAGDFQVTRELADFFGKLAPQAAQQIFAMGDQQGYNGVPVRTIIFTGNGGQVTNELVDVKRQSFPASTFEVPAGYTKTEGMFGGRGRGRGLD
jgi:hypothetical protein